MNTAQNILLKSAIIFTVAVCSSVLTTATDRVVVIPLANGDLLARVAALESVLAGVTRDGKTSLSAASTSVSSTVQATRAE